MNSIWQSAAPYMPVPPRITHRDSIENKVLDFFDRNPGEELTASDAAVKFDSEYVHMSKLLRTMFDRGLLGRSRKRNTESWIYTRPGAA